MRAARAFGSAPPPNHRRPAPPRRRRSGMPPSLRVLRLSYLAFDLEATDGPPRPGLTLFALPPRARLRRVALRKERGPLALAADALFDRCEAFEKSGEGLLMLGLAMPPHLWAQATAGATHRSQPAAVREFAFCAFFGALAQEGRLLREVCFAPERTWWASLPPDPADAEAALRSEQVGEGGPLGYLVLGMALDLLESGAAELTGCCYPACPACSRTAWPWRPRPGWRSWRGGMAAARCGWSSATAPAAGTASACASGGRAATALEVPGSAARLRVSVLVKCCDKRRRTGERAAAESW